MFCGKEEVLLVIGIGIGFWFGLVYRVLRIFLGERMLYDARHSVRLVTCEARRLLEDGLLNHAIYFCKEGLGILHRASQFVNPEIPAEKWWYSDACAKLLVIKVRANMMLGNVNSALRDVEKVMELDHLCDIDQVYVAECLQVRTYIMALIGADELCQSEFDLYVGVLNKMSASGAATSSLPVVRVGCTAADWHRARRQMMLKLHPEIKDLFEKNTKGDGVGIYLAILLMVLVALHVSVVLFISYFRVGFTLVITLSCTVGACFAYGFQALNHDLSHVNRNKGLNYVCMILSSAFCNFPWAMYYQQFHAIHHAYTGSDMDRDGDILFQPWHSPPTLRIRLSFPYVYNSSLTVFRWASSFEVEEDEEPWEGFEYFVDLSSTPRLRFLWSVLFPMFLYPMFLQRKKQLDHPHAQSIEFEGLMVITYLVCWRMGGISAIMYLWLSSMFSLGAFCHPYFGFWLIQHQATYREPRLNVDVDGKELIRQKELGEILLPQPQPTVSYTGHVIWNLLNFGELWHVEHHDFPWIPAVYYPRLREIAPEFYNDLSVNTSIFSAIGDWLFAPDDKEWMETKGDFALRDSYIQDIQVNYWNYPNDTLDDAEDAWDAFAASLVRPKAK